VKSSNRLSRRSRRANSEGASARCTRERPPIRGTFTPGSRDGATTCNNSSLRPICPGCLGAGP